MPRPNLPATGPPNSSQERRGESGQMIQRRYYDGDGRAVKNLDYDHDYEGAGRPHAHDWDWTKKPPRQRARPLIPGE